MIVRELITKLGFSADEAKVKSFDKQVATLTKSLAVVVTTGAAVAAGLFKMTQVVAEQGDRIAKSARDAAIASDVYQEYAYVLGQGGVSTGEFDASLKRLNKTVGDARTGNKAAAESFAALDIRLTDVNGKAKTQAQILDEVTIALNRETDEAKRAAIANQLFGRSGQRMAVVLSQGTEAIDAQREALRRMGGVISEQTLKDSEKFNDELDNLKQVINGIRVSIVAGLLPAITNIVVKSREWFMQNRDIIKQNTEKFVDGLTMALNVLWQTITIVAGALSTLVSLVGGLENALTLAKYAALAFIGVKLLGFLAAAVKAVWAFNFALLANPIGLVVAAVAALVAGIVWLSVKLYQWINANDDLKKSIVQTFEAVSSFIGDSIRGIGLMFDRFVDGLIEKWMKFRAFVSNPFKAVGQFLTSPTANLPNSGQVATQARSGMSRSPINMNVRNDVKISVPTGTTQEQAAAINSQVERQMRSVLAREVGAASLALEGM